MINIINYYISLIKDNIHLLSNLQLLIKKNLIIKLSIQISTFFEE